MRSLLTAVAAFVVVVAAVFPQRADAAAPLVTVSIPEVGVVVESGGATGPGVPQTPNCFGPLSLVNANVTIQNTGTTPSDVSATLTLDPGLEAVANSCAASVGTCLVVNPSKVTWMATLAAGETASFIFTVRVAGGTPINTKLCITLSTTFDGGTPVVVQACATTNSADECGVGAPLLGGSGRALLVVLLAVVGIALLRRHTARRSS